MNQSGDFTVYSRDLERRDSCGYRSEDAFCDRIAATVSFRFSDHKIGAYLKEEETFFACEILSFIDSYEICVVAARKCYQVFQIKLKNRSRVLLYA